MKQDIVAKAQNAIAQHRRRALAEYEEKMRPLMQDEEFLRQQSLLSRIVIENAKREANGEKIDENAEKNAKNALENIKKRYNLQNVRPNFDCPLCNDEGFVNGKMCSCVNKEISKILLEGSGFERLESFQEGMQACGESLLPAYQLMQKWCNSNFKKNLIYLAGPTGVGKTYLLRCMANELIARSKIVKIVTAYALNADFKAFSKSFNDEILKKYTDCEVLFIDDLGTEPFYKNVTQECFYLVLNERKTRGLPTVITSNLTLSDIRDRYDERIYSRIVDRETSITLLLSGADKRTQNKK